MTRLAAEASGSAITNAVDGGINGAFGSGSPVTVGPNGIAFNFTAEPQEPAVTARFAGSSALAFAPPTKAPARTPMMEREWSLWADVRGTSWDRSTAGAHLDGRQLNVTAGLGRKVRPDLVVGLLAGFEDFRYEAASLTGTMKGDGGTVGGYAGWKIAPHLRWDAMLAWSRLSYDAVAGTASGSFNGSRWLASSGLTGRYHWAAFIVEPSARIYALWEHENAYTDSLGTLQGAHSFAVGRVSAGGRMIYPWMRGDVQIAPYVGLYGDYRFSSDAAVPVGQPVLWIGDGLSGRVTGGVTAGKTGGGSVAIGGELGGLGANYNVWSLNGRVLWPF